MLGALLLAVEMLWLAAWARRRLGSAPSSALLAYLREVEARARGGVPFAVRTALPLPLSVSIAPVADILHRAEADGRPLVQSLVAWRRELRRAVNHGESCRRLWRLVFGRATLVLGVALTARLTLLGGATIDDALLSMNAVDAGALATAALLLGLGQIWAVRSLPCFWTTGKPVALAALAWLRTHLYGVAHDGAPCAAEVQAATRGQLLSGVSALDEVRRLLSDWARCQSDAGRERLRRLEEALPLLELTTEGIPAALVLLVPLLESVGVAGIESGIMN